MIENTTPINQPNYVQTKQFSGPLDLLLQLIRKQKMDIFKIDIFKITQKYVEYLKTIPSPDLENTGDFIRMTSMLMYIKSKTLLPEEESEDEEASELKKNLVRLLVNYQKYQTAGNLFYERNLLNRDTWKSNYHLSLTALPNNEIEINKEKASFLLIQNYNKVLQSQHIKKPHKTPKALPSLLERIKELKEMFIQGTRVSFNKLVSIKKNQYSKLLTFLSLLELSKLGFISLFQKSLWSDIDVKIKKNLDAKAFLLLDNEENDWMANKISEEMK